MSSYAKIDDTKDIKSEMKVLEANLNSRIDKVEANLNSRIDKVEVKIAESQISIIKWIVGMVLAQSIGMVFLFLKLSGKF
ncbi:MAG: hypothetical protein ACK4OM_02215 [Alphaproteobacteria bacterium]